MPGRSYVGALLVLSLSGSAWQNQPSSAAEQAADVTVGDAWVRESLPGRPATAAYLTLENRGPRDVRLVGGRTAAARVLELHEMRTERGTMKMRRIDGVTIPAGGKVALEPGGLHLMLIGLSQPLRPGARVELVLRFQDGSERVVEARVDPILPPPDASAENRTRGSVAVGWRGGAGRRGLMNR
jgi:periplasmic copper chaperone A